MQIALKKHIVKHHFLLIYLTIYWFTCIYMHFCIVIIFTLLNIDRNILIKESYRRSQILLETKNYHDDAYYQLCMSRKIH